MFSAAVFQQSPIVYIPKVLYPFGDSVSNGSAILWDVEWQVNERRSLDLFIFWEKEGKKGLLFRVR